MSEESSKPTDSSTRGHHVWCNFWTRPVEDCRLCERLWKEYPYELGGEDELMTKHFPENVVRR